MGELRHMWLLGGSSLERDSLIASGAPQPQRAPAHFRENERERDRAEEIKLQGLLSHEELHLTLLGAELQLEVLCLVWRLRFENFSPTAH